MTRRVYVCPVIGKGKEDDPYRPLIADLIGSGRSAWSATIASEMDGPARGRPLYNWTLVRAEFDDWSKADADGRCLRLADTNEISDLSKPLAQHTRTGVRAVAGLSDETIDTAWEAIQSLFLKHYPDGQPERFALDAVGIPAIRGGSGGANVFVKDTFTDDPGVKLQGHSPDTGGSWQAQDWSLDETGNVTTPDAQIESNVCRSEGTNRSRAYRNAATPPGANYIVRCVARWRGTSAGSTVGLYARMTPTGTSSAEVDRYVGRWRRTTTSHRGRIAKVVSNAATTLAETNTDPPDDVDCSLVFDITNENKVLTLTRLDTHTLVEELSTNDNQITQVGRVGLSAPNVEPPDIRSIDDFVAEIGFDEVEVSESLAILLDDDEEAVDSLEASDDLTILADDDSAVFNLETVAASDDLALVIEGEALEAADEIDLSEDLAVAVADVFAAHDEAQASDGLAVDVIEEAVTVTFEVVEVSDSLGIDLEEGDTEIDITPLLRGQRLRIEVYDVTGNLLGAGPILNISRATVVDALDRPGSFEFTVPATDDLAGLIQAGRIVAIIREGEGIVFRGRVGRRTWEVAE